MLQRIKENKVNDVYRGSSKSLVLCLLEYVLYLGDSITGLASTKSGTPKSSLKGLQVKCPMFDKYRQPYGTRMFFTV